MSEASAYTAEGGHGAVPTTGVPAGVAPGEADPGGRGVPHRTQSPLWEVFVRSRRGLSHTHVGSLRAPDAHMALRNARDVYTRRQEGVSIWVVRAMDIVASSPSDKEALFEPANSKVYRHPTFFPMPEEVKNL